MQTIAIVNDAALYLGDCLELMPAMESDTFDLILTDPPYYKVKGEAWDRQWDTAAGFLAWLDDVFAQFYRLLKPNGSLYVFASPQMAARVEVLASERFNVLNRIRWIKDAGWHKKAEKEALRSYLSPWEEIIFAEHQPEPLREYLVSERNRAGLSTQDVAEAWRIKTGNVNRTGMAGHWFETVQWTFPTKENYEWLRQVFASMNGGGKYLQRDYEDLQRPFIVSAEVPYTDVWTFAPVSAYPGKHPCEKPQDLLKHIIEASTRPGALVLDAFMGTGSTALACRDTGRRFVGIDMTAEYLDSARFRLAQLSMFSEMEG